MKKIKPIDKTVRKISEERVVEATGATKVPEAEVRKLKVGFKKATTKYINNKKD